MLRVHRPTHQLTNTAFRRRFRHPSYIIQQCYRPYFWNSGSGNGTNNNNDDDDDDNKDDEKDTHKTNQNSTSDEPHNKTSSSSKSSSSSTAAAAAATDSIVPSRLGFGDESPRYPHLVGLPVTHRPVFPGLITSVNVTDESTIEALQRISEKGSGYIGVFLRNDTNASASDGNNEQSDLVSDDSDSSRYVEGGLLVTPEIITDASQLHKVGTFAQVHRVHVHHNGENEDGDEKDKIFGKDGEDSDNVSASVLLLAHRRIDLVSVDNLGPPIDVTVRHWDRLQIPSTSKNDMIRALSNEILSTIRELAQISPLFREHIHYFSTRVDANDPYRLADFAASITTGSPEELQAVLEERDPEVRLHKALVLLNKEREVSKLQKEIQSQVESKMSEAQRKYFLREQLKSIKKELGEEMDDKDALVTKYKKKLNSFKEISEEAKKAIGSEMQKLNSLEKNSSEFNVTKSYLDWLTSIPWGKTTKEAFDIKQAREILDRDHYGMDDVKDVILQFIAVGKLRGSVQGKILCLSGPPGVGKTSIAKSIAEALGRKFYRFSVGGLSDVSEIKGHRRTYVGAMPGKIIQCLKTTESSNPLILIDEIDKLGRGYQGDPASALLELLDPSQNSTFRDHYLDVPVDLSKVLFMCTANVLDTIPGPLLDRMEVIQLSGYDLPDKVQIAEKYLIPKSFKDTGISKNDDDLDDGNNVPNNISISRDGVESLARWYAREAGVRNLQKYIEKICRKLALQVVAENEGAVLNDKSKRKSSTWQVTQENLSDYVGKPIFTSDRMYEDKTPHGIVMGLAWTSMGGSALYIETQGIMKVNRKESQGTMTTTGKVSYFKKVIFFHSAKTEASTISVRRGYVRIHKDCVYIEPGAVTKVSTRECIL